MHFKIRRLQTTDYGRDRNEDWRHMCSRFPPSQAGDCVLSVNWSLREQGEEKVVKSGMKKETRKNFGLHLNKNDLSPSGNVSK